MFQNRNLVRRLTAAELAQVHGVVLFGDPYFNGGSKAARGREFSSTRHAVLGRRGEFAARAMTPPIRVHSYCHGHDPICQGPFIRIAGRNVLDPKIFGASRRLVNHENYSEFGEPQASARHFAQLGASSSAPARPKLWDGFRQFTARPARISVTCADGGAYIVKWETWTATRAVGEGTTRQCRGNDSPIRVVADQVVRNTFTRLAVRWQGYDDPSILILAVGTIFTREEPTWASPEWVRDPASGLHPWP